MDAVLVRGRSGSVPERFAAAAGACVMGVGSAAVWYFDPVKESFFPACPLYRLTGFACPGCGMTRAFHALFHGDILTALDFNALVPVFAVLLLFFFVSLVLYAVRGRGLRMDLLKPQALWAVFILLMVFGVLRNLPFYPFDVLFP
jgi:hypothetical protein